MGVNQFPKVSSALWPSFELCLGSDIVFAVLQALTTENLWWRKSYSRRGINLPACVQATESKALISGAQKHNSSSRN